MEKTIDQSNKEYSCGVFVSDDMEWVPIVSGGMGAVDDIDEIPIDSGTTLDEVADKLNEVIRKIRSASEATGQHH